MACNRNESVLIEQTNSAALFLDHETTRKVARDLNRGGDAVTVAGILVQAGVISAPYGWVVAIIGVVISAIGDEIRYLDEGCGIVFGSDQGNYFWRAQ